MNLMARSMSRASCSGPLHAARGIRRARLRREVVAVHDVAAVRRQREVAAGLGVARAGLRELARHAAHLHDGHRGAVGEDHGHLQHGLDAVADLVGRRARKRLGAVAALQEERAAVRGGGQAGAQQVDLAREHQRREQGDLGGGGVDGRGVRPPGLLLDLERAPVVESGEDVGVGGDEVLRGHGGIPVRVVREMRGGVRRASVSGPRSRASP
jgi:hypothetical protein